MFLIICLCPWRNDVIVCAGITVTSGRKNFVKVWRWRLIDISMKKCSAGFKFLLPFFAILRRKIAIFCHFWRFLHKQKKQPNSIFLSVKRPSYNFLQLGQKSPVVPRTGIEPVTNCLEGNCSILWATGAYYFSNIAFYNAKNKHSITLFL